MSRTSTLLMWLAGLLVLVGIAYAVSIFFIQGGAQSIVQYPDISKITQAKMAADKTAALSAYQEIKGDPAKTVDEKALADITIAGVEYVASNGDISARIKDIQNLKKVYLDETVAPSIRAAALGVLGQEYYFSSKNPAIYKEVYKDAPFNSFLVPKNPELTTINIEKASYDLYPSTVAAITIANIAAVMDFPKGGTSPETLKHIALAEEYLNKADAAAAIDAKDNPTYTESDRYTNYSYAHAYTVGHLAITKGDPYRGGYRRVFDDLIASQQTKQRLVPNDLILNIRFQYARILDADKDTAGEKKQLDEIAKILNGISDPKIYSFVQYLQNSRTYAPNGVIWTTVQKMYSVSPDFKAAVTKVLTAASK